MKKIYLLLCFLVMMVPVFVKAASTVTNAEELESALMNNAVEEVKLGNDITLSKTDFTNEYYRAIISGHKVLDLNGHVLTQNDGLQMHVYIASNNATFEVKDSGGNGKINCYDSFFYLYDYDDGGYENFLVKLHDFDYENLQGGDYVSYINDDINTPTMTVENIDFFYPQNSPLSNGFNLIIKSLTVTPTDNNPVGFYNDGSVAYLFNVVHPDSVVYCNGYLFDDWENTLARDVFLGAGSTGKIIIKDHCTISFQTNGGSTIDEINVPKNSVFGNIKPDNPTKDGYRFFKWYLDGSLHDAVLDSYVVKNDLELHARYGRFYQVLTYDLNLHQANNGGFVRTDTGFEGTNNGGYILEGEPHFLEQHAYPGNLFVGWVFDDPTNEPFSTEDIIDLTYEGEVYGNIYAVFEKGVNVTFNSNGGSAVESQMLRKGTKVEEPKDPNRDGYEFVGWYKEATFENVFDFDEELEEDITLYAKWNQIITAANATFTKPYATMNPDFNIIASDTSKYEIQSFYVYEITDGYPHLDENSVYELDHEYEYRIAFRAKEGYTFNGETVFTFNGEETDCYGAAENRQKRYIATVIPEVVNPTVSLIANNNVIKISWDNQINAVKYIIYRSNDNKKWSAYKTVTTTSFIDKSLTYNKAYYYKVRACDNTKCSGYSNLVGKKILPNKVNLSISSASTTNIKLHWDRVATNGYEIYRSTNKKTWSKIKTITNNTTLDFNNTKLKANTNYYYKVIAYKTVSGRKVYGPWSDIVATRTAPLAPAVALSIREYNEINITMAESKGATHYYIYKSHDNVNYELIHDLPGPGVMADGPHELGTPVYYKIRVCNAWNRCSAFVTKGIWQSAKTPVISLISPKTKVVTATVTGVDHADGYEVYRSTNKTKNYKLVRNLPADGNLTFNNITKKGVTYYYRVRSYVIVDGRKVYSPLSGIRYVKSK